jgi:hypothetical protein
MSRSTASWQTAYYLVNVAVLTTDLDHKMSLELRVKERLLLYPEEVVFDSQGIPTQLLSSCPIMLVLG